MHGRGRYFAAPYILAITAGFQPPIRGIVHPYLRCGPALLQVNSDSRATQEYFDFLLGRVKNEVTEDGPSIIVGNGRIGSMLLDFGSRNGYNDVVVKRGDVIPSGHAGPVYVCTQTADLAAVIAACPEDKKDDLVFLQDGMLEPLFQRNGIYGPTQASLWLACMRKGGKPVDGRTHDNPEGLTTVTGKWAGAFASRMSTGNLACEIKMDRDARRSTLERLVFLSAYHLVGTVHGGITIGEVAQKHADEAGQLCRELASFVRYTLSVSLFSGIDERLEAYAQKMEFLPTALTDFEFRNGYFYRYTKMAGTRITPAGIKVQVPDTTPTHTEYLLLAQERGLINQSLLNSV